MLRNSVSKRNVISVSLVVLLLGAMTLALKPRAAKADEEGAFKGTLTVTVEVITASTGCFDAACNACVGSGNLYIEAQGIGETSLGTMFGEVLKCLSPTAPPFGTYSGTLTTTSPNGKDSLIWAYSGQNDTAGDAYGFQPFSGTLTVTGGTGKFAGAQGSATFTATSGPASAGPNPANSVVAMAFYSVHGKLELRDND